MNNEPVAYGKYIENAKMWLVVELDADMPEGYIPLYTHSHPDNLGLAESIIKQQELQIEALKAKDLKKSMAIRSLNTQLKKALQYETYSR